MGYDAGLQNVENHSPRFLKPGPHTFLHRMKTSRVKIRPVLKNHFYFITRGHEKLILRK